MTKRVRWIDCAKALAILAVMTDHTTGILYTDGNVALASYFSVPLFVIIAGMMCYGSNQRRELTWYQAFFRSSRGIVAAYLLANAVYMIWNSHRFDLLAYLRYVVSFNQCAPFYYVLLYLQLMLVGKLLYSVISRPAGKYPLIRDIAVGAVLLAFCSWTTGYTDILGVYGGGGKLLGGTFLFLFYLGMLVRRYGLLENVTLKKAAILSAAGLVLWYVWWRFACVDHFALDSRLPFGGGFNPPSITETVMAVAVLCLSCGVFSLFEYCRYLRWITSVEIGRAHV